MKPGIYKELSNPDYQFRGDHAMTDQAVLDATATDNLYLDQVENELDIDNGKARGIYYDIDEDIYRASPYVSQSSLKAIGRSPAHYKYGEVEETDCMRRGTMVDMAITAASGLAMYFPVPDKIRRNTKAWVEYKEGVGENVILVKQKDYDTALRAAEVVNKHPTASKLLADAKFQPSIFWDIILDTESIPVKGRPDLYNSKLNTLVDIKLTGDARTHAFQDKVARFGYHIQNAFYSDGWHICNDKAADAFIFIVIEEKPPYALKLHELTQRSVQKGCDEYHQLLEMYTKCSRANEWPGYPTYINQADLPGWYYYKEEDES